MQTGQRHRSKNTMFWRADEKLKALLRDPRWVAFHRACGREGLFFDDIDPINDDYSKEAVTDKMRGRGYQAIAFRVGKDKGGFDIQEFRGRGTGQGPVEAVIAAYQNAIERGDPVSHGLEEILLKNVSETTPPREDDYMELIG
jgi:hypothetical protein